MMNKIALPLLLLFSSLITKAQTLKWDSTHRPGNYARQVDNFRSYPNAKTDIIMLGNSITDFAQWNELLQMTKVKNRGISGDITFGILERLDEVTEGKPAKIFILIGINDIARNIPDSVILDNYKRMIHRIKKESPKTKIYFNSLLPVNNTFPAKTQFNKDEHVLYINEELKKTGTKEGITVIDIHPLFLDADKRLDKQYTYDGLHLNAAGYKLWASILKPYLKN